MFFFFKDTATTEIYPLSLHDALPICTGASQKTSLSAFSGMMSSLMSSFTASAIGCSKPCGPTRMGPSRDRKSTRLNSSHSQISYAVFCLKKKKDKKTQTTLRATPHQL